MKLYPSKEIWEHMSKVNDNPITPLQICSALADRYGGYYISYSATELLKDLDLLTKAEMPNKKGRLVLSHYLHEKYHRNIEAIEVVNPYQSETP